MLGRTTRAGFIDAFVDNLDLAAAGFDRVHPKGTGRPGYHPGDLVKLHIYGYVPKPIRGSAASNGFFTKEAFAYDRQSDAYTCPGGHHLTAGRRRKARDGAHVAGYANPPACRDCALRTRCTKAGFRSINRYQNDAVLERMAGRLKDRSTEKARRGDCESSAERRARI